MSRRFWETAVHRVELGPFERIFWFSVITALLPLSLVLIPGEIAVRKVIRWWQERGFPLLRRAARKARKAPTDDLSDGLFRLIGRFRILLLIVWGVLAALAFFVVIKVTMQAFSPPPLFSRDAYLYRIGPAILAFVTVLAAPFFIARSQALERQTKAQEEKKDLDRRGQISERFIEAAKLLAETRQDKDGGTLPRLESRLSAVYALEGIAEESILQDIIAHQHAPRESAGGETESPDGISRTRKAQQGLRDYNTVMEILCAYVRESSRVGHGGLEKNTSTDQNRTTDGDGPAPETARYHATDRIAGEPARPRVREDIRAATQIIARLHGKYGEGGSTGHAFKTQPPDLRRAYLHGVEFNPANSSDLPGLQHGNLAGADLSGVDLRQANLQKANLEEADLQKTNLEGANLQETNLYRSDLRKAYLSEAFLQEANLREADLQGSNLNAANLQGSNLNTASLQYADLTRANLQGADLREANLQGSSLNAANLQGSNLNMASLQNADLARANLQGADLREANLEDSGLREAKLQSANLYRANLKSADLSETNLRKAKLREANLQGANLREASLQETDLREANLEETGLGEANLQGANLYMANLRRADLSETNLQKAKLIEANLQEACLMGANLPKADLRQARLQKANLREANLVEAGLDWAILHQADLRQANLQMANLHRANLQEADLGEVNLREAFLKEAKLQEADLRRANLQGITPARSAVWKGAVLAGVNLAGVNDPLSAATVSSIWGDPGTKIDGIDRPHHWPEIGYSMDSTDFEAACRENWVKYGFEGEMPGWMKRGLPDDGDA